jgi:SAM-dependent methyltransferase
MKRNRAPFSFGANWQDYVKKALTPERIEDAVGSLRSFLGTGGLEGNTFLDIGCGSGLFSLAARRLGARVHSFDFDPLCVACTEELKRCYFADDDQWAIEQGDVLDVNYLNSLGQYNLVYSWGVLHHTGSMWKALENVIPLVREDGRLFLSIYNDQGWKSRYWRAIKKYYNQSPGFIKFFMVLIFSGYFGIPKILFKLKKERGMSFWYDVVDWIGGYPFEVARPEEIFDFYREKGFVLMGLKTRNGLGCNEFVFQRLPEREKKGQER